MTMGHEPLEVCSSTNRTRTDRLVEGQLQSSLVLGLKLLNSRKSFKTGVL